MGVETKGIYSLTYQVVSPPKSDHSWDYVETEVKVQCGDQDLRQMLNILEGFLKSCGYSFPGPLDVSDVSSA